jgi:hypothetical protein
MEKFKEKIIYALEVIGRRSPYYTFSQHMK